jgi:methylmalonyl-CoA mutase cobalamin-binding subunit
MRTLLCAAAVTALVAFAPLLAQSRNTKLVTHQVFIAVTDPSGAPVLDLGPGDFEVNEGGVKRTVVRAGLSKEPMRVALLVDTGEDMSAFLTSLRASLIGFLDALPPEHEVMLASTGRQFRVRVQPTADRKKLKDAANGLFGDGGGTVLMDGLLEADTRFLRKAENRWPVFVIVTSDGAETSAGAHEKEFNQWIVALAQRGVSVHAFVVKTGKGSGIPEMIALNATHNTGGRYDVMNTTTALPEKMKTLGAQLAADAQKMSSWYTVEFQTDAAELKPIDVAVARNGVKLQMSYRRGGP